MLARYSVKREDNGEITMSRSKCSMSFSSKMIKCEDAISTVNINEKEVRFKARVGKEQSWEYLGKRRFYAQRKSCCVTMHLRKTSGSRLILHIEEIV